MTITRLWQAGAESGDTNEFSSTNLNFAASSTQVKTGSYSFFSPDQSRYGLVNLSPTRQIRVGFFIYVDDIPQSRLFTIRNSTAELIGLDFKAANFVALDVATVEQDLDSYDLDIWTHWGIDVYIDSSSGWVKIYKDGSEVMSFTGNTGNSDINNIQFGHAGAGVSAASYFDDAYIEDTTGEVSAVSVPIKRFYSLIPNADGIYSQWTPNTGTSHFELVNERPPDDDITFLEAVTGSLIDSFDMDTFVLDTNEDIIAMIPFVFAKRGSSTEQIALGTRSSGTDSVGNNQDLSTNYDYVWERQITGSLGSPWNQSYMDSIEVIIKSAGTYE